MKNTLLFLIAIILLLYPSITKSQVAPGSVLTDGTDEAFLQSIIGANQYEGTLLFRMSTDGNLSTDFHTACDLQGPTLVIMRNAFSSEVFGGYTEEEWHASSPGYSNCGDCILFNLTHDYSLENSVYPQYSTYNNNNYGPTFGGGHDLYVPNIMDSGGYTNDHSYDSPSSQGHDYLHGGTSQNNMTIDEIEVYAISVAPLPIELSAFTVIKSHEKALLNWTTSSEVNNLRFNIEKSSDANYWETIGAVEGSGTSYNTKHYSYIDENPLHDVTYYRLKQIDLNGSFSFSKIESLTAGIAHNIAVYPNPTQGIIYINGFQSGKVNIHDPLGKLIAEHVLLDQNEINISSLPMGVYFISFNVGEQYFTKRILKSGN
jgi:hypothetical protein